MQSGVSGLGATASLAALLLWQHRTSSVAVCPARGGWRKGNEDHAIGRSHGGLSPRINVAVDQDGLPLRIVRSDGQVSDKSQSRRSSKVSLRRPMESTFTLVVKVDPESPYRKTLSVRFSIRSKSIGAPMPGAEGGRTRPSASISISWVTPYFCAPSGSRTSK